jgi:hypothetical protein
VHGRTGGAAPVTLGGRITDGADAGGGILVSGNSGGSTVLGGANSSLSTGAATGVEMTTSPGHTLRLDGGGLTVTATTGKGVDVGDSGTLAVTGAGNTITTGTGRALRIQNTGIHSDGATFQRISANGAPNGILLASTGNSGSLTVTGTGSAACTQGSTAGCTGGEIASSTGGDDAGTTPAGTGVVLTDTKAPSLTRMWIHDATNYAIRGDATRGLVLDHVLVNGTNGDNAVAPYDEAAVVLTNLTGSPSIVDTYLSGGLEDTLRVLNGTSGDLDRLALTRATFALSGTRPQNDALSLESGGTGAFKVTVDQGDFRGAQGDQLQLTHSSSGAGDLTVTNTVFDNQYSGTASGGGGVFVFQGGTAGPLDHTFTNDDFRRAVGNAVLVSKGAGSSKQRGSFTGNRIGQSGSANSGSLAGDGLKLWQLGGGSMDWTVTGNTIRQYNLRGIEVAAGDGPDPHSGTLRTVITGNTILEPGNDAGSLPAPKQGVHFNLGITTGDSFQACADISGNTLGASGADGNPALSVNYDIWLRQRMATTLRLAGYGGATNDNNAVAAYLVSQNSGADVLASNSVSTGGGGYPGGTCPALAWP